MKMRLISRIMRKDKVVLQNSTSSNFVTDLTTKYAKNIEKTS
jgi:hypothetical protein